MASRQVVVVGLSGNLVLRDGYANRVTLQISATATAAANAVHLVSLSPFGSDTWLTIEDEFLVT